jgi:hypothetical protein
VVDLAAQRLSRKLRVVAAKKTPAPKRRR